MSLPKPSEFEVWFVTGSQHLYGDEAILQVGRHSEEIAQALDSQSVIPCRIVFRQVMTTPDAIYSLCKEANQSTKCIGLILWMHTFSPAKMWIRGLQSLQKPFLHLHTQFNRELPWGTIDMDFMNLNQAAHGDREFGFINTRLRIDRKVVVGHWSETRVGHEIGAWCRAALAWNDWQGARFVRFGDNMREVAVTEGDKVSAQAQFGFSVNTYGVGDLVAEVEAVSEGEVDLLVEEYSDLYVISDSLAKGGPQHDQLRYSARQELGIKRFLQRDGFSGFTDTFEDLHGLQQLPGIAVQRLMAQGYGFGAEGDWKHTALLRAMKVMSIGLSGGTSFMEDYTYHMEEGEGQVLGAHMLEICPSLSAGTPSCEIHPLGIGGKEDPVRLVFTAAPGPGLNASLVDLGNRFRFILNEVEVITPSETLPHLPVARALWKPLPDFSTALRAWIQAGGAHHTGFTTAFGLETMEDFAQMAQIECLRIDSATRYSEFCDKLHHNEAYYFLAKGISHVH